MLASKIINKIMEKWLRDVLSKYLAYQPLTKDDGDYVSAKEIIDWIKAQPRISPSK